MMKVLEIKQFNAARDAWTAQRRVISLTANTCWRVCVCEKTKRESDQARYIFCNENEKRVGSQQRSLPTFCLAPQLFRDLVLLPLSFLLSFSFHCT